MRQIEQIVSELGALKQNQIEELGAHMICLDEAIYILFKYQKLKEILRRATDDEFTMDNKTQSS